MLTTDGKMIVIFVNYLMRNSISQNFYYESGLSFCSLLTYFKVCTVKRLKTGTIVTLY